MPTPIENKTPEWTELDRVKLLYRPVIDLDNGGVTIEPNFEEADKALENLLTHQKKMIRNIIEEAMFQIREHGTGETYKAHKALSDLLSLPELTIKEDE